MIIRRVTSGNDWTFGQGTSSYAIGEEAIEQNVKTRILEWVNDCFFNLAGGVDWRNRLSVGQQQNLQDEVNLIILQSYGVVSINALNFIFNPQTRNILVQYDIQTIFSPSFQSQISQASGVNVNSN